jgi:hypothetical protein
VGADLRERRWTAVHNMQAVTFDSAAAQAWLRQPSSTDGFARAAAALSAPAHITR